MRTLVRRTSAGDYLLLAVLFAIVAAVLYPIFAQSPNRSRQTFVFDENGKPVPHARLQFADASGNVFYTTKTDKRGWSSDRKVFSLASSVTGEYVFQGGGRNTGSAYMVIAKRGTQVFTFRDGDGQPVPDLPVVLGVSYRRENRAYAHRAELSLFRPRYQTDAWGRVELPNIGLAQRIEPQAVDMYRVVKSVKVRVSKTRVDYDVVVDRVATVVGYMTNAAGKPVVSQEIVLADPADRTTDYYSLRRTSTDSRGKFVFGGLASGNYAIRFKDGKPKALVAPKIVVRSGEKQTVRVVVP